jgi:hypothetical protein
MIVALVVGHGMSYAAAICRHHDLQEHVLAHQSRDAHVALIAQAEEEAADAASKKAPRSTINIAAWAADMLPSASFAAPFRIVDVLPSEIAEQPPMIGRIVAPLLRPPLRQDPSQPA